MADIGARAAAPGRSHGVSFETTRAGRHDARRGSRRRSSASGLQGEQDFFTVFSPERVYSGRVFADLATYPKLVGGLSDDGRAARRRALPAFLDAEVWPMGGAEAAELAKLAETTYRDVNIAFANELARFADARGDRRRRA